MQWHHAIMVVNRILAEVGAHHQDTSHDGSCLIRRSYFHQLDTITYMLSWLF